MKATSYLDPALTGTPLGTATVTIEREPLRLFAAATGQTRPVYTDLDAALAAGHPDLPVPPTYLSGLGFSQPEWFARLSEWGVDLGLVLHAEQRFDYHAPAHAGDTLVFEGRVGEIYTKKGGALEFLRREISVRHQDGRRAAEIGSLLAIRHPEVTA